MKVITVLLADDHTLVREGLAKLLQDHSDIQVVGAASNGAEAVKLAQSLMPDVILMDVRMPVMDGLEATQQISLEMPNICILMLTMSGNDQDLFEAVKSGARGYILKNATPDELYHYIVSASAGETPISGVMAGRLLSEFKRVAGGTESPDERLTKRESDVLELVAQGMSNHAIAEMLNISENTVKKHHGNVLAKLHLKNRVQAALYAKQKRNPASL